MVRKCISVKYACKSSLRGNGAIIIQRNGLWAKMCKKFGNTFLATFLTFVLFRSLHDKNRIIPNQSRDPQPLRAPTPPEQRKPRGLNFFRLPN